MRERERENFWPDTQSSHELILAAKASNGGGHCSCSTDTTPDRGSGWPRLRGSGGVPVRARGHRGHSVGALRGRQSPELIRAPASPDPSGWGAAARLPLRKPPSERGCCACFSEFLRPSEALRACSCHRSSLSHYQDGLHKPPPLATRFSVAQIAKEVKSMYLGGVLRPQKPTSTCAPPIHVHLQRRGPPSAPPCCFPELRANLRDIPSEGR